MATGYARSRLRRVLAPQRAPAGRRPPAPASPAGAWPRPRSTTSPARPAQPGHRLPGVPRRQGPPARRSSSATRSAGSSTRSDAELDAADDLEDLLVTGVTAALRLPRRPRRAAVRSSGHEPELVLPHFAFHRLDRLLAVASRLCRPHLGPLPARRRRRPAGRVVRPPRPLLRVRPSAGVDLSDPTSVRRLVSTYLLPARRHRPRTTPGRPT